MLVRKIFTSGAVTLALMGWGAVVGRTAQQPPSAASPSVGQDTGTQGSAASTGVIYVDNCRVVWADERIVSSKIPGRVDRRLVQEGSRVEPGEILAVLDDRDARYEYQAQYILSESELAERAQEIELREYVARKETAEVLFPSRAISREEHRLASVRRDASQVKLEQEREKKEIEKIKADRAKVFLDDHVITSPIHGIVQKAFKREKESVTAGDLQMFRIVATDKLWVEGRVQVRDLYRVRAGQDVEVQLVIQDTDALIENLPKLPAEQRVFKGKIIFKDPEVDFSTRTFRVRAEVENQDELMWAGQSATMRIKSSPPAPKEQGSGDRKT